MNSSWRWRCMQRPITVPSSTFSAAKGRLPLSGLLEKGDGGFLRSVAEAVLQLLMAADVDGLIGAGRYLELDAADTLRAETGTPREAYEQGVNEQSRATIAAGLGDARVRRLPAMQRARRHLLELRHHRVRPTPTPVKQ